VDNSYKKSIPLPSEYVSRDTMSDEFKFSLKGNPEVAEQYLSKLPWELRPSRYKTEGYSKNIDPGSIQIT